MHKVFRGLFYIIVSILLLLLFAVAYLNSPWGQDFVRGRVEAYLQEKIKTKVSIGHLGYGFPKYIVLNDALVLDQKEDTLLDVKLLKVDLDMWELLHRHVDVQQVIIKNLHSHIYRHARDTAFNFTYIIDAFSKTTASDTAKSKSITIDLDKIRLDGINLRFDDSTGGILLSVNLNHLDLDIKKMDLDKMIFQIKNLSVAGVRAHCTQEKSYIVTSGKPKKEKLKLVAENVDVRNVLFDYDNHLNKFLFAMQLGSLQLNLNEYNRDNNLVDIKKLAVSNSSANLVIGKSSTRPSPVDTIVRIDTTEGWNVRTANAELSGINFKMDNANEPRKRGFDYSHLDIHNLALNVDDLTYSDTVAGKINNFSVTEQSGLVVNKLKTKFTYSSNGVILRDLFFKTPNTVLQNHIEVHYPSLASLKNRMQSMQLNLNLVNSVVGLRDAALFIPSLEKQDFFRKYKNTPIKLEATMAGFLDNLDIKKFHAGVGGTEILLSGRVRGLPERRQLNYNLHVAKFQSSRSDILEMLPPSAFKYFRPPLKFGLSGQIAGTLYDYHTNLVLVSTDGYASVNGSLAVLSGREQGRYDMMIKTRHLNLGGLLKMEKLFGIVTTEMKVKGQGFDIKTLNTSAEGDIISAWIKGYRYHDISLKGTVAGKKVEASIHSDDPNLNLVVDGHADFSGKYPAVSGEAQIYNIDFKALNWYKSELSVSGTIKADIQELNPDYPHGCLSWLQPIAVVDGTKYSLDSLCIRSMPEDLEQNIFFNVGFAQASIRGTAPLSKIDDIVTDRINRYSLKGTSDTFGNNCVANRSDYRIKIKRRSSEVLNAARHMDVPEDYNLDFAARIIDNPFLRNITSDNISFDSVHIDGQLTPRYLGLNVKAPWLVYYSNTIRNAVGQVSGNDTGLTYKITADRISRRGFDFWYTNINGSLDKGLLRANVSSSDEERKERFAFKATMQIDADKQIVQILPGLKLNYIDWNVAQPNRIVLASNGLFVQNLDISNQGQSIIANSVQQQPNSPLKVTVTNFQLGNVIDIGNKSDTLPVAGSLSGTITMEQLTTSLKLNGDLQVKDFAIHGDTVGNIHALVSNKTENELATKISLTDHGNEVSLDGVYFLNPNNGNDFNYNIKVNLALRSFEGLLMDQISNSSGYLRGNLHLEGTMNSPRITGALFTENMKTTVTYLNTSFSIHSDRITFSGNQATIKNFNILDSTGNAAKLNGTIDFTDLFNPALNLTLSAKEWNAVSSAAKLNADLSGHLLITTDVKITGTATAPSLDGNLTILKGTKVNVLNPNKRYEIESAKGIVKFVNIQEISYSHTRTVRDTARRRLKLPPGSGINLNVKVEKEVEIKIIIDESTGEFATVQGDGTFNVTVSLDGDLSLTGVYTAHSGTYEMNYSFISRKFTIKDGSTVTFAGDVYKYTTLDVTATYKANTPPYDLVVKQITDPAQLTYYKQNLPFEVNLHLVGDIMQPSFSFDIALPQNKVYPLTADQIDVVQSRLSQIRSDTAEVNKQAFAVLILGRFVSDNPFINNASQGLTNTGIQSLSSFIGQQLNQMAGDLIKGIDLTVDLATTQDFTTGNLRNRTDLNVSASKRILNDRLKFTVGNSFEVEGPQSNGNNQNSIVPSNLAIDYLLSPDGRYSLRAYRRSYDEGALQGYITETGLTFILSADYNRFRNIFTRGKHKRKQLKRNSDRESKTTS